MMTKNCILFAVIFLVGALSTIQAEETGNEKVQTVDERLKELKQRRDRCMLDIKLAQDSANRRLNLGDFLGYRRDIKTIEHCKEEIKLLDAEIEKLEKKKS